jgi:crotonobetainyl-CoA:carnitine CoA-transferase CaiB-like acyl-CoA transferase
MGGIVPGPMGTAHPNIVPYQVFAASDRPFVLAAGNDRFFERACEVIGRRELATDERFATNADRVRNRDALALLLQQVFATESRDEWLARLEAAGVPCAPVRTLDEVFASPEGARLIQEVDDPARGLLKLVANPIKLSGESPEIRLPPPRLGEHDDQGNESPGTDTK